MRSHVGSLVASLALTVATAFAQILDDFSEGGWTPFSSTPGRCEAGPGRLTLEDAKGAPEWMTASKVYTVDLERTPVFIVSVTSLSDRGQVKLIRKEPFDKREAVEIDRPGLYAVDMGRQFGWTGTQEVEACLYALGDAESITFGFVKIAAALSDAERAEVAKREAMGSTALPSETFALVPSFGACSFYLRSPPRGVLAVEYRPAGGEWLRAFPPPYFEADTMYRGSVVNLEEDAAYELRITAPDGIILAESPFRTWRTEVPIAQTIVLDETSFVGTLAVKESGTPEGWIRYTARDGFVLRNDRQGPLLELQGVSYILLDGLTLRGGLREAISIRRCQHVRVINCDIAGWGRLGMQDFQRDGKYYTESGSAINWDSAIVIRRSVGTVVERCYIHDPLTTANPWYYSHPAGPQAVGIDRPTSTVLRYNDFIGSDAHRWNDAVEGAGNFSVDGGFNRDADIYGNLMCFANDDALEIDGGQTNVRVYGNRFEGCLCGLSIQGCMASPSYVFRNLIVNLSDEKGVAGQSIKTSSYANGRNAVSFIINNTTYGQSSDLNLLENLRVVARNNIFGGRTAVSGRQRSPQSECDYNLLVNGTAGDEPHGVCGAPGFADAGAGRFDLLESSPAVARGMALDNLAPPTHGVVDLGAIPHASARVPPWRPIPVVLDRSQVSFPPDHEGPAPTLTVTATVTGDGFKSRFRIARNDAFDWFTVAPTQGVLQSGQAVTFTVTVVPERLPKRRWHRGAFLVRLESGFSRPVMVYAAGASAAPLRPAVRPGAFVAFLEAEQPSSGPAYDRVTDAQASGSAAVLVDGPADREPTEYCFTVPKAGTFFLVLRIRSDDPVASHDTVRFGLDAGPLDDTRLLSSASWTWSLAAHNRKFSLTHLQGFDLSAGSHILRLAPREPVHLDVVAITDDPAPFDERAW